MKKLILAGLLMAIAPFISAQNDTDKTAILQAVDNMAVGWNKADGDLFAKSFANTHDFIVWNGYYFKKISKEMNARSHTELFKNMYPNTRLDYVVDQLTFVTSEVAILHVLGAVSDKSEPRPEHPMVLFSVVLKKTDSDWKIVSFHNLDLEAFADPDTKANAPIPTSVMYASWYETK